MNEAIWGLIGIGVGWLLSEFSSFMKSEEENKSLEKNLKILLKSEFFENKELLNHYYEGIVEGVDEENIIDRKNKYVQKLCKNPLPEFSRIAYKSQLTTMGRVFKKNEISSLIRIYSRFSQLQNIYLAIKKKQDENNEAGRLAQKSGTSFSSLIVGHNPNYYYSEMRDLWDIFVNEKEDIISTNLDEIFILEID